ncbi:MAG TPA: hypothetical protein VHC22_20285 [Pirellulales bacterium]|nr:hypothetical protein [Pirellulales bacterium]
MTARFQFSIGGALLATALFAIVLGVLNCRPGTWYAGLSLILLAGTIPSVLVVGLFHLSGYSRAFCVGASVPALAGLVGLAHAIPWVVEHTPDLWKVKGAREWLAEMSLQQFQYWLGVCWFSMPFSGLLCIAAEWVFMRSKVKNDPPGL